MRRVIDTSTSALNIAGSLCGVPFVGAAAIIVNDIVRACDEVKAQKRKSRELSNRCVQLLNALNDQVSNLEESELQQLTDQIIMVLERIQTRTRRWSNYNSVTTFLKNGDIKDGLDTCERELDTAMNLFQINSNTVLQSGQRDMIETMRSNTAELRELLIQALTIRSETQQIIEMQNAGEHVAERFMEAGQRELLLLRQSNPGTTWNSPPPQPRDSRRYLQYQRGLINLHRETGIPPTIKVLDGEVTKVGELAVAGGTYSDIWVGMWLGEEKVALKSLRNVKASDPKAKKRFENEINLWADLRNNHILPFYGIVTDLGQQIHMVSPWQANGNVLDYVKAHDDADRSCLIAGAAQGLEYLHSRNIIHGNMKCANILVSDKGDACICDFGMSKLIEEVTETSASATLTTSGSARWLAPEVIEGKVSSPTMAADTYSYAMAILELVTGKHPFADHRRDAQVIFSIVVQKQTPPRPVDDGASLWVSDGLWSLMQGCWHKDAQSRPSMTQVASRLMEMNVVA
ncbi:TKL/TKL-ccin protein kinase [Phlegmacium glaucopus]|nr:TKL/TKL-ccin protein kinase [Phlegmacium glaucopus]